MTRGKRSLPAFRRRAGLYLALIFLSFLCLAMWPAPQAEAALAKVTKVTLEETPGGLQLVITTSHPVRYERRTFKPDWIIVDVFEAELGIPAGTLPIVRGVVTKVRVGQFTPDVVRVVVELAQPVQSRVSTWPRR